MKSLDYRENQIIIKKGQKREHLLIIVSGTVSFSVGNQTFYLEAGSVIGLLEATQDRYLFDYIAVDGVRVIAYSFRNLEDLNSILQTQPAYAYAFLHASLVHGREMAERYRELYHDAVNFYQYIKESYEEYVKDCMRFGLNPKNFKGMDSLEPLQLSREVPEWKLEYLFELSSLWEDEIRQFYDAKSALCIGEIMQVSQLVNEIVLVMQEVTDYVQQHGCLLLNEYGDDLLSIFYDWSVKLASKGEDTMVMFQRVRQLQTMVDDFAIGTEEAASQRFGAYWATDFAELAQNDTGLSGSMMDCEKFLKTDVLKELLECADYDRDEAEDLRNTLELCLDIKDIHDTEDSVTALRKALTRHFYGLYPRVFLNTMKEGTASVAVEMFLRFGVLDLRLLEENQIRKLYEINSLFRRKEMDGVYTMLEWLKAIFRGQKEPSRNDFDQDYKAYLVEQMKSQQITREQAQKLQNNVEEKIKFEISNMFMTANRATYGRVTTFCPVLFGKDLLREADSMLVSDEQLHKELDDVRKVDFSCFYRQVFFQDPAHGIPQVEIWKEVLPDMILMPNVGSKGMMWQELSGVKKDTPARFMFPIFTVDDLSTMMLDVSARYRWEICRRIQGVHWNDIREKSLTSEYSDYIQYYRKNSEISPQNKEKIKQQVTQAKNNYREVFVQDYRNWMKYETKGNLRLNSVARKILVAYCPFDKSTRMALRDNPLFKELYARYDIVTEKQYQKVLTLWNRYQENAGELTPELQENLDFYQL